MLKEIIQAMGKFFAKAAKNRAHIESHIPNLYYFAKGFLVNFLSAITLLLLWYKFDPSGFEWLGGETLNGFETLVALFAAYMAVTLVTLTLGVTYRKYLSNRRLPSDLEQQKPVKQRNDLFISLRNGTKLGLFIAPPAIILIWLSRLTHSQTMIETSDLLEGAVSIAGVSTAMGLFYGFTEYISNRYRAFAVFDKPLKFAIIGVAVYLGYELFFAINIDWSLGTSLYAPTLSSLIKGTGIAFGGTGLVIMAGEITLRKLLNYPYKKRWSEYSEVRNSNQPINHDATESTPLTKQPETKNGSYRVIEGSLNLATVAPYAVIMIKSLNLFIWLYGLKILADCVKPTNPSHWHCPKDYTTQDIFAFMEGSYKAGYIIGALAALYTAYNLYNTGAELFGLKQSPRIEEITEETETNQNSSDKILEDTDGEYTPENFTSPDNELGY